MSVAFDQPTFVICHPRSGSTLVRFILDTHSSLACPPELHLGPLMAQLVRINSNLYAGQPEYSSPELLREKVSAQVRKAVNAIMYEVCQDSQKEMWVEKSVTNIEHLGLISHVYPKAKYICLYRHCLDFVDSAREMILNKWTFGYEQFVFSRNQTSGVLESLIAFWCQKTQQILDFQRTRNCLGMKYEDLVSRPNAETRRLFEYLDLPYSDALLADVFRIPHKVGNGDPKIWRMTKIETSSVGRGQQLSLAGVDPVVLVQMNNVLESLGYRSVPAPQSRNLQPD